MNDKIDPNPDPEIVVVRIDEPHEPATSARGLMDPYHSRVIGDAIDAIEDVRLALVEQEDFVHADRLRTVMGRLARTRPPGELYEKELQTLREVARTWK